MDQSKLANDTSTQVAMATDRIELLLSLVHLLLQLVNDRLCCALPMLRQAQLFTVISKDLVLGP